MSAPVEKVELESREMAVFVRLVRCLVGLDHQLTKAEVMSLAGIGDKVDAERFWVHLQASFARPLRLEEVLREARNFVDSESRLALIELLDLIASSDALVPVEKGFLGRLRTLWKLK